MEIDKKVCITGIGVVNSVAKDVVEFAEALREGKHGFSKSKYENLPIKVGAFLNDFSLNYYIKKYEECMPQITAKAARCSRKVTLSIKTSIACCMQAWFDAKLNTKHVASERIGVIIGGSNISQNMNFQMFEKYKATPEYVSPSYALQFMDTNQMGIISDIFHIKGEGYTVGGASASGNVALINGYRLIKMGIVDVCVVIGTLAELSPVELQAFMNLGAIGGEGYSEYPEMASRPFDEGHTGFIYGQGAACVILENEKSAKSRKVHILAEMLSGAIILDANHLSDAKVSGEVRAMEQVLKDADIGKDKIDYINAHGTSTPQGDQVEIEAIKQVFGNEIRHINVNSTKGLIGHCLYSAGVIEAVATIIQQRDGFLHGNRNLYKSAASDIKLCGLKSIESASQYAISNSFGFGGINTSILIKKGDK